MMCDMDDPSSLEELLERVQMISEQTLESVDDAGMLRGRQFLHNSRFRSALFDVMADKKAEIVLKIPSEAKEEDDRNLTKLDNMLTAEGVLVPDSARRLEVSGGGDSDDYQQRLLQIRNVYKMEMKNYEEKAVNYLDPIKAILQNHGQIRPISHADRDRFLGVFQKKLSQVEVQIKQNICETVMLHKTKFNDARHKRRNFSKQTNDVMNEYFYTVNPYPSEDAKEQLARQCGISVPQVSNWFGNKRIRNKKNLKRAQEEVNMYNAKRFGMENPFAGQGYPGYGMPAVINPYAYGYGVVPPQNASPNEANPQNFQFDPNSFRDL